MNYEKAYKKALETARDFLDFYKDNPAQAQKFIDIFPELTESEDERIRKGLLRHFRNKTKPYWNEIAVKDIIAYLEKQKEQKHPNGCFTCDEYKKGYEAGRFHGFTAGYNKAMKEQNPAEWSEEDERMLDEVLDRVTYAFYNQGLDGEIEDDPAFLWLHRLRPHWKPSEEQMEALHTAAYIEEVDYYGGLKHKLLALYEDLKKLM